MSRTPNKWKATVQGPDGQVHETDITAHWNPDHESTEGAVKEAARVKVWTEQKKPTETAAPFVPLTATAA